jgi:glycosyltransferase involved in cell wall biosynthesis
MGGDLLAQPIARLLQVEDLREPLRVVIASLVPGGAERIVIEWLAAEAARSREIELAVLYARQNILAVPPSIRLRVRDAVSPADFLESLARDWRSSRAPVSTHLVPDDLLEVLWRGGVSTVPVVHNVREGWRNEPRRWLPMSLPLAVACAEQVRVEVTQAGCPVPVITLRHRPAIARDAFDLATRSRVRAELGIGSGCLLVLAVGAIKPQKDYPRAAGVLARLCAKREAALVIVGGVLGNDGLAELDRVLDAAIAGGVSDRLRLPGFAPRIEPWLAAADVLLNVSRFEGLSIATQEALAAGLPVVATEVGGQSELAREGLELVPAGAPTEAFASRLHRLPVRAALVPRPGMRVPRAWSLALTARAPEGPTVDTLFVTANLNAGGAQRSLVNLACALAKRHAFELAVCGESTQVAFAEQLRSHGVSAFRPASDADAVAVAESLLARAALRGVRTVCFWNVDPKVKLLMAKFAPAGLRLFDVSPGAYAFAEMADAAPFADAVTYGIDEFYRRLDLLVLKFASAAHPPCARIEVIENGVALPELRWRTCADPRFVVSGRIAPSKRLDTIVRALARVQRSLPAARLDIFGLAEARDEAYLAALRERAQGLPVFFRGASASLAHLEGAYTAAVILGTHQGSPNAILEAMAARIPVIANASGGTAAMLEEGAAGWLLPESATAGDVADAMEEAYSSPAKARARAERAWWLARDRHGIARMAQRYLDILDPAAPGGAREKMAAWNSVSARGAPQGLPPVPSPATAAP